MNLKHIIASLFVACAVFTSCAVEEDEIFDQPSSLRADAIAEEYNKILTSAQNGWVMEYYPSAYQTYGGFVVACKFSTDGTVEVTADYATGDKGSYRSTSYYQVCPDGGIKLTVDTYNDVLHYLSDPSYSDLGSGTSKGYEGDFDFHIISCSAEKVVLKGTKTGSKAEMYPISGSIDEYLAAIHKISVDSYSLSYESSVKNGDNTTTINYSLSDQVFTYVSADGVETSIPFVYTTTGIKFFESTVILGNEVSELTWDGEKFVSKDGFAITPVYNVIDVFKHNTWYMSDMLMDTEFLQYFYYSYKNFFAPNELNVSDITIEFGSGYAFVNYNADFGSGYMVYTYSKVGENTMKFDAYSFDALTQSLWTNYKSFRYIFYPMWDTLTIEIDDLRNPSYAVLTNESGSQFYVTIEPQYGPFDYSIQLSSK